MKNSRLFLTVILGLTFMLSGCVVRSYKVTRDRVDQDLATGNRGFLMGSAPKDIQPKDRKTTRSTHVVEVELRPPVKFEKKVEPKAISQENVLESSEVSAQVPASTFEVPVAEEAIVPGENIQKYTVEKNDTLQKISQKFYGTTKKWMKIYDANRQVLKAPNKIYPGQIINVPVSEGQTAKMSEPAENLK